MDVHRVSMLTKKKIQFFYSSSKTINSHRNCTAFTLRLSLAYKHTY